jgi:DNA-binding NarL/FixJ family response regulator
MPLRILLVDDHPVVRHALRRLLEHHGLDVVGETADDAEASRLASELRVDIIVMDVTTSISRWLAAAAEIVLTMPLKGIILVTSEDYLVSRAFQAGIRGYVLKKQAVDDLPLAIRTVAGGNLYLSPGIPSAVVQLDPSPANGKTPPSS